MTKTRFKVGQTVIRGPRYRWCICKGKTGDMCFDCRGPFLVTRVIRETCESGWCLSVRNKKGINQKRWIGIDSSYFNVRRSSDSTKTK